MAPPPKYAVVRKAVASSLLAGTSQNKLLTVSQFVDAFSTRIRLGGGITLTEDALKKSFSSRGDGDKYCLDCSSMNVGHDGECVLVVLKSYQITRGAARTMAFGIFDSQECVNALEKYDVLEDDNVGRLQLSLTDALKADLANFLMKNFPPTVSSREDQVTTIDTQTQTEGHVIESKDA